MGTDKDTHTYFFNINKNDDLFFLRKCTFDDLEKVKKVNERELPEDYPFFFYKSILDNYPNSFLVACDKNNPDEIIGYVMWRVEKIPSKNSLRLINKGHLVSIAVSEGSRQLGIASALLTYSMPPIREQNVKEFVLEVRVSNYNAVSLYKNFNFKNDGIKKRYYRDGENAYYMILKYKKD